MAIDVSQVMSPIGGDLLNLGPGRRLTRISPYVCASTKPKAAQGELYVEGNE